MREKKIFCVYGCFSVTRYINGGKKSHLDTQLNFQTHMYKQPTLTNQWNYNIFVRTLYSFFRYTGRLFLECALFLLAVIFSGLHEKLRRNEDKLLKKVHRRVCERGITFLTVRPPFYVTFCCFLYLLSPTSQVKHLLNGPYKDT